MSLKTLLLQQRIREDSFASILLENWFNLPKYIKFQALFGYSSYRKGGTIFINASRNIPIICQLLLPFSLPNGGVYLGSAGKIEKIH